MTNEKALLLVTIDIFPEREAEFNEWYETVHIPPRLKTPGFLSARRFVSTIGEPKYMALYDLSSADVLASEAYLKLREKEASRPAGSFEAIIRELPNYSRGVYRQIYSKGLEYKVTDTPAILAVGIDIPRNREEEFNAWYNTEHIPALSRVPGIVTARRFEAVEASLPSHVGSLKSSPRYVALYDLENEGVFKSDAFSRAADTPWTAWIHTWYTRRFLIVGRRIYPKP